MRTYSPLAPGLTREQVLAAVEKFEKDEELDKLLSDITGLSEMFNVLKEENIEARVRSRTPFPHVCVSCTTHSTPMPLRCRTTCLPSPSQPLPEHVTKDLILAIARENAEMTIKVIRETSAKQKAEKLSDEQAAEVAEYVHLINQ